MRRRVAKKILRARPMGGHGVATAWAKFARDGEDRMFGRWDHLLPTERRRQQAETSEMGERIARELRAFLDVQKGRRPLTDPDYLAWQARRWRRRARVGE